MVKQEDKDKILGELHFELHLVRRIKNYKPTALETKMSYLIAGLYADECSECLQVTNQRKALLENQMKGNVPNQGSGFLDKVLGR